MEWRQQSSLSCADAFDEARRWIQEVTGKSFGCGDFRAALENGVLLCDLINQLKPGIIKRVNRLSTPIAGLDNVNVFLKACGKLGLNESQLFHPGDLQDLSTRVTLRRDESQRRVKNVLVTIYWLGRKAQLDPFYSGPQLNFKAFEGLLGLALSKALEEGSNVFVKDGGYKEYRSSEGELCQDITQISVGGNLEDGFESLDTRALRPNEEACGSDAEAEQMFKMDNTRLSAHQNKGGIPPPLRRKQGREGNAGASASPLPRTYEIQVRPERPVQVNPGWIWSKSLSDIPMVYPVRKVSNGNTVYNKGQDTGLARGWSQESERKRSIAAKDSEAQWQDDLTKWKNRRRSTKSELYRKSQDREHVINQMANGTMTSYETYESQGGPIKRFSRDQSPWQHSAAPRPYSTSSPSKPSSSDLRPRSRAPLAHSYATEEPKIHARGLPVGAMPTSAGSLFEEETYFASLASDRAGVTTPSLDHPFTSQTQVKSFSSQSTSQSPPEQTQPQNILTNKVSSAVLENSNTFLSSNSSLTPASSISHEKPPVVVDLKAEPFCPDPVHEAGGGTTEHLQDQIPKAQEERQGLDWDSAVGNRTQQAAGNSRYVSRTVTWSRSASLPRGFRRSEGSSSISSAITARPFGTKQARMSSVPRLYSVDDNQGLLLNAEKEDSLSASSKSSIKRQTAAANLRDQYQASVRQKKANQARQNGSEQRQEVRRFSLQSSSQILPQPYPNLPSYHNKSPILSSKAPTDSSKVDHSDMRVSLTLKPNSVPDFGFQTYWDSTGLKVKSIQPASPAEHCQLCVDDEIVAVDGVPVAHMTPNQWKDKMASSLQTGSLTMDIRRYGIKDWSNSKESLPNQPGQSRMTLNLTSAAPVLIGYPDHHANGVAPADTKTSKSSWEKEHGAQDKSKDGVLPESFSTTRSKESNSVTMQNQKRREEFFNEKGGSESAISDLQVPSLSPSTFSWSWDREEDRRRQEKWQEEQERLLQEQYQRDQERLEAEWRQAQQDAVEGRKLQENACEVSSGPERFCSSLFYNNGLTKKTQEDKQRPDGENLKEVGIRHQNDAPGAQNDKMSEKNWALSSSTPALSGPYKQSRGDPRRGLGRSVTKAERERQQILEEMKKRTQLLTDNSWIRQRSNSFHKEPVDVGASIKRYESLDNLDTLSSNMAAAFSYPRPHSAAGGYVVPSRNAASRYSTGSMSLQRNAYTDSSHYASVWAAADISEEQRLESRSVSETGSPIVSAVISNSSPLVPCDQHDVLQIEE
ncbi:LIM domain only protein 7 isoform X2 [Kryptolebias marmoratus]|uniref:LIM domain 7b n=1 Tax=Kryptolebias marmoratus TaxID=37003 RepID=A0A3Q2Z9Y4_KRYMA|nr:LIM domain only protein 7 isoform X2 [Kryptolebias marmoratus]